MLHKAWNSKEEMPYCFPRSSIKFQGHTGQNITDFDPNWAFRTTGRSQLSNPSDLPCCGLGNMLIWFVHKSWNKFAWWCHQMETFSMLLAVWKGNSPVTSEFPSIRPVMQSFDVFFDLCLNKRLSKQSRHQWYEMPLRCSLWCHCNVCIFPHPSLNPWASSIDKDYLNQNWD